MRASAFFSTILEAEMIEVNHVKITEKKILCTKNPVARPYSPVRVKKYLRICEHPKTCHLHLSSDKKGVEKDLTKQQMNQLKGFGMEVG